MLTYADVACVLHCIWHMLTNADVCSVLRFMAVFDPFTMGAMLLFKIALPFVLVAATFGLIAELRGITRKRKRKRSIIHTVYYCIREPLDSYFTYALLTLSTLCTYLSYYCRYQTRLDRLRDAHKRRLVVAAFFLSGPQ
jgi:hypothetical protein